MKRIFLMLGFLLFSHSAFAVTYYACSCDSGADGDCVAGSDSNNGTSTSTPWLTYTKVRNEFTSLNDGDSILMCKGGSWLTSSTSTWYNYNSTKEVGVTLSDYNPPWSTGDEDRPYIEITNGGDGLRFTNPGDWLYEEGFTVSNLHFQCNTCAGTGGAGIVLANWVGHITVENNVFDGFKINVNTGGPNGAAVPGGVQNQAGTGHIIKDNIITNAHKHALFGHMVDGIVEGNYMANNGDDPIFDHAIYFYGGDNVIVRDNEILDTTIVNGECSGNIVTGHGFMSNFLFEGNYVHNTTSGTPQCNAIAIGPGYSSVENYTYIVIRGNTVENSGGFGIGVSLCNTGCVIENNVIIQDFDGGHWYSGIRLPVAEPAQANEIQNVNDNLIVRNNSIYINAPDTASTHRGIFLKEYGDNHVVTNNAIYITGGETSVNCFDFPLDPSAYASIDNNVCEYPAGGQWENGTGDLAAWQAATVHDDNSIEGVVGFADTTGPTYDLSSSGPSTNMVDNGSTVSGEYTTIDFNGGSINGGVRDIGAYEYGAGAPPTDTDPSNADAGSNQAVTLPSDTINIVCSADDDGLPNPPGALSYTWSCTSCGGSEVSFGNASASSTAATSTTVAAHTLQCSVSDGDGTPATATMTFTVNAAIAETICSGTVSHPLIMGDTVRVCGGGEWQ